MYAESSAVLSWLLGESAGAVAWRTMHAATRVVTSSLTRVECARTLMRAHRIGELSATEHLAALRILDVAASRWDEHALSGAVISRASGEFPVEAIRTLDALHLATALVLRDGLGSITVLSHDDRLRRNAAALDVPILPDTLPAV